MVRTTVSTKGFFEVIFSKEMDIGLYYAGSHMSIA
jgi:hypothetical protein